MNENRKKAEGAPLQRTRVVLIIDEETGELDYFVMRDGAEMVVLNEPIMAPAAFEARRRCH